MVESAVDAVCLSFPFLSFRGGGRPKHTPVYTVWTYTRVKTHSSVVQIRSQQPSATWLTAESGVGFAVVAAWRQGGGC